MQEKKPALSNSTSGADGSDTPQSLLEGCINSQTATQAFVVNCTAKGQMLGGSKIAAIKISLTTYKTQLLVILT